MYLLLSGEGPGDIGICSPSSDNCNRSEFNEGPMALIIDQLIEVFQGYEMSHLATEQVSFVSKAFLARNKPLAIKKSPTLRGKKRPAETCYFFNNARALAIAAKMKSREVNDAVIAILFRDSDGTASAGRGNWQNRRNSMIEGFRAEAYEFGVPMVPKPKSEAWLLCATKEEPYQHCAGLEGESGNDDSGRPSLKEQFSASLSGSTDTASLNMLIIEKTIDVFQIDMPSFNIFKEDLERVVMLARGRSSDQNESFLKV